MNKGHMALSEARVERHHLDNDPEEPMATPIIVVTKAASARPIEGLSAPSEHPAVLMVAKVETGGR